MILIVLLRAPIGQIAAVAAAVGTASANGIQFPDAPPAQTEEVPPDPALLRFGNYDSRFVLQFSASVSVKCFDIFAIPYIR
jgi:hypothetical protein